MVAAARKATQQIPIVMSPGSDPVALGFVTSLGITVPQTLRLQAERLIE